VKAFLAAVVLVGLSVRIAKPDDTATFHTVAPDKDWRLEKRPGAQPQKIGVLRYYPNKGGGYTFMEGGNIVFYSLPLLPTTDKVVRTTIVTETTKDGTEYTFLVETINVGTVGTSKVPYGGQTLYGGRMMEVEAGVRRRTDIPLATWSRDTPNGRFGLSVMDVDPQTRVKLKSIVPMLEHASK